MVRYGSVRHGSLMAHFHCMLRSRHGRFAIYMTEFNSGKTEAVSRVQTVSETHGAYGICSRSHAAGIASYETISALVTWPSPEMGMALWHTLGGNHTGLSARGQTLLFYGQEFP
ncbi:hypothetical protein PO909_019802 [Leuciscus waleckii]